ncbi:hypothetical protein B7494_g3460 [Chlorociboria aeruginascens]|nr:hypothetical protein B7494_g3460 [Chlorociboria aeruginascens]
MSPFNPSTANKLARTLKALHIPGHPVVFTNIWDAPSASLALSQPKTKALATASYAVAAVNGLNDEDLTLEANLACISKIAARIAKEERADSIPLSVDLQDGYGNRLPEAVEAIIDLGAVGINLEDSKSVNGKMELITAEEHVQRIGQVLQIAAKKGVPDFVINARTDAIVLGGTIEDAIERGKKYLEARATTVFVWGGSARGLRDVEVE